MDIYKLVLVGESVGWMATNGARTLVLVNEEDGWEDDPENSFVACCFGFNAAGIIAVRTNDQPPVPLPQGV